MPQKRSSFDMTHALSALTVLALIAVFSLGAITPAIAIVAVIFLALAVAMSVHHAEVIALRVGPSLGALILAVAVTVIEVGLIVSMMTNDTPDSVVVARDTVFSAVIIVTNGILGVCFFLGGLRHKELGFQVEGASSLLAVLATLVGLTLILPNFTTSTPGPTYSVAQLIFAAAASLILYVAMVVAQTVTHKDYFQPLPVENDISLEHGGTRPSRRLALMSTVGLLASLCAVIGLAKALSPSIEAGVTAIGAPRSVVGIVIALLVLLPETGAAIAAAKANQLQTSLNLALGSGVASIALTIPVVSVFSIVSSRELALGLESKSIAFTIMTFLIAGLTLGTGKITPLKGLVHLMMLFAYLVLSFIP